MPDYPEHSGRSGRAQAISRDDGHWPVEQAEHLSVPESGHPHGKPSSWVLAAMVVAAFSGGGAGLIFHLWWLFWACAGIVLLAIPTGKAIGIMDDTVSWARNPAYDPDGQPAPGARRA